MFGPSEAGPGVRESFAADLPAGRDHADLSGRPAGSVLRNTLALQGNEGRLCRDGRPGAARAVGGQPAGRAAVVCDAASCTEGLRQMLESEVAAPSEAVRVAAHRRCGRLRRRAGAAATVGDPQGAGAGAAPHLFVDPDGDERLAARCRGGGRRHGDGARRLGMLRVRRGPRNAAPGADRSRPPGRRRPNWPTGSFDAFASCNRTCELGMTRATGAQYQHVLELVDWASRPPS